MSKYVGMVVYETEFEGDHVRVELEPLTRQAFMEVYPKLRDMGPRAASEGDLAILDTAVDVVSRHIKRMTGLRDAANNEISIEIMLGKVYFSKLISEIFAKLMESSALGEGKSAN